MLGAMGMMVLGGLNANGGFEDIVRTTDDGSTSTKEALARRLLAYAGGRPSGGGGGGGGDGRSMVLVVRRRGLAHGVAGISSYLFAGFCRFAVKWQR